jgi:hypothetical protein
MRKFAAALLALPLVAALSLPALADEHDHDHEHHGGPPHGAPPHGGGPVHPHDFRGREFHHFDEHEREVWTGGRWHHDWHGGRFGWWWDIGGVWYFYPEPVYPYPTYVTNEVFIDPVPPPPAIVVAPPPPPPPPAPVVVQVAPQPTAPPPQFWYYCDNPAGYYPYVASCSTPWREVPATPAR